MDKLDSSSCQGQESRKAIEEERSRYQEKENNSFTLNVGGSILTADSDHGVFFTKPDLHDARVDVTAWGLRKKETLSAVGTVSREIVSKTWTKKELRLQGQHKSRLHKMLHPMRVGLGHTDSISAISSIAFSSQISRLFISLSTNMRLGTRFLAQNVVHAPAITHLAFELYFCLLHILQTIDSRYSGLLNTVILLNSDCNEPRWSTSILATSLFKTIGSSSSSTGINLFSWFCDGGIICFFL